MSSIKNIQIPQKLLIDVYRLVTSLDSNGLDFDTKVLCRDIETQIGAKLERMERHQLYTQSKVGETDKQRETARQEYLDKVGMHKDWRY